MIYIYTDIESKHIYIYVEQTNNDLYMYVVLRSISIRLGKPNGTCVFVSRATAYFALGSCPVGPLHGGWRTYRGRRHRGEAGTGGRTGTAKAVS